jgi:hypothetical protein
METRKRKDPREVHSAWVTGEQIFLPRKHQEPRSALKDARLVILTHDSFEQIPRNQLDECHSREHAGASLEIDSGNFIA